jgi:hypothetical protein
MLNQSICVIFQEQHARSKSPAEPRRCFAHAAQCKFVAFAEDAALFKFFAAQSQSFFITNCDKTRRYTYYYYNVERSLFS